MGRFPPITAATTQLETAKLAVGLGLSGRKNELKGLKKQKEANSPDLMETSVSSSKERNRHLQKVRCHILLEVPKATTSVSLLHKTPSRSKDIMHQGHCCG